jgi:Zn-dependent peptidase ImmA (M78 family)
MVEMIKVGDMVGMVDVGTSSSRTARALNPVAIDTGEIDPWLPRRSNELELLEEASRTWGVSMQALLFRARTRGTLSEDAYRRAMRRMSAAGWRTREPVDIGPAEAPELLRRAVEMLPSAGSSLEKIAAEFGVPAARLARMLSVPEERDDADGGEVVQLRAV